MAGEREVLKRLFLAGAVALLLIQVPFPAPASSPQTSQAEQAAMKPLQHEVSVVLKLIHVYVTDKKDKPVTDLTMSDFTVTDNGQPVTLTDFEKRILRAAAGEPKEGKPDLGTAEPAAPAAPALRRTGRKFFFFFDYAFNNARGIVKARTAALHFLDSEVRAQAGYFNPKPFGEFSPLEKQLHLVDLALNERALSRLPDKVPMTALSSAAEGIARLAVLARLPGEVTAKFSGKRLEFVAIFFDGRGEISNMVREEIDPASLRGRDMAFAAGSVLKPGEYACRLVVRDMDSGMSAVGSAKATIGKPLVTGLELGTPLILEPQTGCSLVSAGAGKGKSAFLWADLYPYDSAIFSPVLAGLPAAASSLQVVMPCAYPGAGQTELAVSANLVNAATGARSPVTIARLDRAPKGPHEVLTLEILTAAVPPGAYYLHIYAQDRATASLGHSFAALVVPKR